MESSNQKKIWVIVTVARQVEGEYIQIKFEKAYLQASKADEYVKELAKVYTETVTVPGVGPVDFLCERGVHELEISN